MKKIILPILFLSFLSTFTFAKARFAEKKEMIKKSETIIIAKIEKIEKSKQEGKYFMYRQKVTGTIENTLKGNIDGDIIIYGMENFKCAQNTFSKGHFLLFLRKDNGFWVGSNWHLGIRPIKEGKVEWFKNNISHFKMEQKPLKEVISEIQNILKKQKK